MLIISYEMFVRTYELLKSVAFDLVVCDEGHRLKNSAIKTTSLISSLRTRRRVVLSGTPIQNDLQEFFAVADFCNPGVLGELIEHSRYSLHASFLYTSFQFTFKSTGIS